MFGVFEDRIRYKVELASSKGPENKVTDPGEALDALIRLEMHLPPTPIYVD
ncbi:MAG: hypothetical protein SWK76_12915 [Actinomycetota bacterium]|nr:hypothetical protein [Actinomycetota bacterium]